MSPAEPVDDEDYYAPEVGQAQLIWRRFREFFIVERRPDRNSIPRKQAKSSSETPSTAILPRRDRQSRLDGFNLPAGRRFRWLRRT